MTLKYANKWKMLLYVVLALIHASSNVTIAYLTMLMINDATTPGHTAKDLLTIAAIGSFAFVLLFVFGLAFQAIKNEIIREINLKLKRANMRYLLSQQTDSQKAGLSLMTNDLKQVESQRITNELMMISELMAFLLSFTTGMINSWLLTLVLMGSAIIPGYFQKFFTKSLQTRSEKWVQKNADYTQSVSDGINGSKTAMLYNAQKMILKQVVSRADQMEMALKQLNVLEGTVLEAVTMLAMVLSFLLPFLIGTLMILNGQLKIGTLILLVQLSNQFINPMINITSQWNQIKATKPIWDKVVQALDFKSQAPVKQSGAFKSLQLVDLSYQTKDRQLFKQFQMTVKPGEKVLLMAPSGWGKTTLLRLMLGQLKANSGQVLINGQDVSGNWDQAHNYFGYINQKPFIFDNTLRFNLLLGRQIPEQQLAEVIKQAGLSDLVREKGLDYLVGQGGANLSGGQVQRIEIARALLSKRPILLADEATSSLDPQLSLEIHKTLLLNPNVAVVEVAHKISAQEKALYDRILKLDQLVPRFKTAPISE